MLVAGGAFRNDGGPVVVAGVAHADRGEDVFLKQIFVFLAGDVFEDSTEDEVAGIVVVEFGAGFELEITAAKFCDEIVDGVIVTGDVGEESGVIGVTRDAGSVTEELGDGYAGAGVLAVVGEIAGDVAVEFDAALGYLLENEHGGELLGDRAKAEFDVRGVGDVPLAIGEAVAAFEDNFVVFGHKDGTSELAAVGVLTGELVDFGGFVGGLGRREGVHENEKDDKAEK